MVDPAGGAGRVARTCARPSGVMRATWREDVWKELARNVRGVPVPQCGHLCQEERLGVVNAELLDFLSDWNG